MEETDGGEPGAPQDDLVHELDVDHSEDEDKLVEDEIPEFVFDVLPLGNPKFAENHPLDRFAQYEEATVCHVDQSLQKKTVLNRGST